MNNRLSGLVRFDPVKNTENMMSPLYFNDESDHSEENTCGNEVFRTTIIHHRKSLNIFTLQQPI